MCYGNCCICEILLIFYDFCGRELYATLFSAARLEYFSFSVSLYPFFYLLFLFHFLFIYFVNFLWSPGLVEMGVAAFGLEFGFLGANFMAEMATLATK